MDIPSRASPSGTTACASSVLRQPLASASCPLLQLKYFDPDVHESAFCLGSIPCTPVLSICLSLLPDNSGGTEMYTEYLNWGRPLSCQIRSKCLRQTFGWLPACCLAKRHQLFPTLHLVKRHYYFPQTTPLFPCLHPIQNALHFNLYILKPSILGTSTGSTHVCRCLPSIHFLFIFLWESPFLFFPALSHTVCMGLTPPLNPAVNLSPRSSISAYYSWPACLKVVIGTLVGQSMPILGLWLKFLRETTTTKTHNFFFGGSRVGGRMSKQKENIKEVPKAPKLLLPENIC